MKLLSMGTEFQFHKMKSVLEVGYESGALRWECI